MTERAHARLPTFLEHAGRPEGTLRYHELQGFLFAVANAPELAMPSDWMPIVFSDKDAGYRDLDEARLIVGELMTLFNSISASVSDSAASLPDDCAFREDVLANLEEDAPVSQWSRGFLTGHQWLEDSWEYVPEQIEEEFAAMLMTLSFFASRQLADAFLGETQGKSLQDLAETMRRLFPTAMFEYATLGRAIHQALMEEARTGPVPRTPKVGRNELCPCGSGRKYKKCCGAAEQ